MESISKDSPLGRILTEFETFRKYVSDECIKAAQLDRSVAEARFKLMDKESKLWAANKRVACLRQKYEAYKREIQLVAERTAPPGHVLQSWTEDGTGNYTVEVGPVPALPQPDGWLYMPRLPDDDESEASN